MGVYAGPNIVESGLVLSLDAGNTRSYPGSGTTWTDLSGQGNNGTLTNGPTYNNGAIVFDGVDDYILTSLAVTAKTVFAFIKLSTAAGGDYVVYGLDANGADNWLGVESNRIRILGTEIMDVNNFSLYGTTTLSADVWYQIGCTIDTNTAKVYLNGKEENTTTKAFTIGLWNTAPVIGRRGVTVSQRYFPGSISMVTVHNRILSADEISQNFNALRGRFGI